LGRVRASGKSWWAIVHNKFPKARFFPNEFEIMIDKVALVLSEQLEVLG
jgi:hypothetical protein